MPDNEGEGDCDDRWIPQFAGEQAGVNEQLSLAQRLALVEEQIAAACRTAERPRGEVELVAVSKTHPSTAIVEAVGLGLHLFGENRVQEFAAKSAQLAVSTNPGHTATVRSQIQVHLIGHLQSNKVLKAVEVFDGIDSVDSVRIAERLDAARGESVLRAGTRLPDLKHLEAQGLMTIAPLDVAEEVTRGCFRALRQLRDKLSAQHPRLNLPVLSMGMSGDFALAIAEGATRIRIGTALFGSRAGNA